jgi:hypothetical protein
MLIKIIKFLLTIIIAILHPIAILVGVFVFPGFFAWLFDILYFDYYIFIPNSSILKIIILFTLLFLVIVFNIKGYKFVAKKGQFASLAYTFCLSSTLSIFLLYCLGCILK